MERDAKWMRDPIYRFFFKWRREGGGKAKGKCQRKVVGTLNYNIYIGEAVLEVPTEEEIKESEKYGYPLHLGVMVKRLILPDAPVFPGDQLTENGNDRHPGYIQWADFCKTAGIYELFFDKKKGLMNHPGCLLLLPSHLEIIRESLTLWKKAHPKAIPGWCECRDCYPSGKGNKYIHEELDNILARLIWLEFWTDWALKNCKVPAIYNF